VFVSDRDGDERVFNYDLWAVPVRRGTPPGPVRRLTDTPSAEYAPAWSPDGRRIAYLGTRRALTSSETTMEDEHVWTISAAGADARDAGSAVDNRQGEPAWDGDGLVTAVQERGDVALYRLDGAGARRIAPPPGRPGVVGAWSRARDGTLAYAMATPEGPAELYLQPPGGSARRLTSANEALLKGRALATVDSLAVRSADGLEVEAFFTHPLPGSAARAPRAHPLIVILHGGPHAQQGPAFNARAQVYAARGWASLQVNYRGSTGYGQKLADAIFGDQNGGEARDVLTAMDAALARYPFLDPERIGVEGGSYGGQLVNWLVTQDGRFRAGVSTAGISNLVSFNYMAYYHDYLAVEFGSFPHEGDLMDRLWQRSPLRHVARVRTPVLLLHGENDNDVPVAEAEQFYVALHDVGVPTALVRYPREGHGLRETAHQVDALQRSIEWYERWFKEPRPEPRPLRTR
jgi:dipeptidyl aminopeptidase/acylaminoacyl peptidase